MTNGPSVGFPVPCKVAIVVKHNVLPRVKRLVMKSSSPTQCPSRACRDCRWATFQGWSTAPSPRKGDKGQAGIGRRGRGRATGGGRRRGIWGSVGWTAAGALATGWDASPLANRSWSRLTLREQVAVSDGYRRQGLGPKRRVPICLALPTTSALPSEQLVGVSELRAHTIWASSPYSTGRDGALVVRPKKEFRQESLAGLGSRVEAPSGSGAAAGRDPWWARRGGRGKVSGGAVWFGRRRNCSLRG